jgi:hypothetical protein
VIASPGISPPAVNFVWKLPDGSVRVAKSAPPATIVIHPGNADQMEEWFARQQRDSEDIRLISFYGAEQCVAAGIVTPADAERLAPPKPRGRDLSRTVG